MSAKEMFEELGYGKVNYPAGKCKNRVVYRKRDNKETIETEIIFYEDEGMYLISDYDFSEKGLGQLCSQVDIKLNKAIQQQIKELRWEE